MQDNYIGDIGDYGKYGLLRMIDSNKVSLAINWYKVMPKKIGKQDDGKYITYLSAPQIYRQYDPTLFEALHKIVCIEQDRSIERIERENLFSAQYHSQQIGCDRLQWHQNALLQTDDAEIVFLDPDNGLETVRMHNSGKTTEKHVKWSELKDYYSRGQNVILYQHRPQMTKKEECIENIMNFQKEYLCADFVKVLEFPKYTNRFYFMFIHEQYQNVCEHVCASMIENWGRADFCREIVVE